MAAPKNKPPPLLPSHRHNSTSSLLDRSPAPTDYAPDKENAVPVVSLNSCRGRKLDIGAAIAQQLISKPALKPSSLQLCMKLNEPNSSSSSLLGASASPWEPLSSSSDVWDQFSDSESAPASSWSTLPNRSLLYRPLPVDVGRCTCIIAKERTQERSGLAFYTLYTNEGQGRQDRKLAVAWHRRRNGRSEFIVAQNPKGIFCSSDESFLGSVTANLMGSKYQIWDQGNRLDSSKKQSRRLLGFVSYIPTITTIAGNYRSLRAWVPKYESMQLKNSNTAQIQHINGLPNDWGEKPNRANQLVSRTPFYNTFTKRNELDFRERAGRTGPRIQTSVKNFQLTMEVIIYSTPADSFDYT
ncbi:tubby-like protein 4 [Canna indica]|uniref:Tubby-like protein 4 n=1 Tax=Canna indica TaxID=4628 RepID=A0AAQ3QJF0_9LILI|nr:tubby-like protein 4 [Canna indica]